jgi:serine/threonine protein kinase
VARKSFPARGDFRKEAQNLARFNGSLSDHKRIVKYLAVITIQDEEDEGAPKEFNILLPLADADLQHFLSEPCYDSRCGGIVELILEASNLADAIRWLHGGLRISGKVLFCCHMDLKLDNILVYLDHPSRVGWWKISDFGISSMVERTTSEHSPRRPSSALLSVPSPAQSLARITGTARFSVHRPPGPYTAPEMEYGNEVGPSSDIWSFGCILYQVLARGAGGIELLKELDDKRMSMENGSTNDHFYQRTNRGNCLHPSVSEWLESPHSLPNGSFVDRIMVMNCKLLIQQMLRFDPKRRPNAEQLHDKLAEIANGEGESYYFDRHSNLVLPPRSESPRRPLAGPIPEIEIRTPRSSITQAAPHSSQQKFDIPAADNSTPPTSPPVGTWNYITQPNTEPRLLHSADVSLRSDISVPKSIPPPFAPQEWRAPNIGNVISGNGTSNRGSVASHESQRQPNGQSPPQVRYYRSGADVSRRSDIIVPKSIPPPFAPQEWRASSMGNVISGNGTSVRGSVASHESQQQPNSESPPQVRQYYFSQGRDIREFVDTSPELVQYNTTIFESHGRSRQQSEHTDVPDVQPRPTNRKGEIVPFTTPGHVIMTLVSSTRAKIAFVAPKEVVVSTLYSPYSRKTILPPTGCLWEKGSLAGDFLALHGFCSSTTSYVSLAHLIPVIKLIRSQVFHLWKLSIDNGRELEIRKLDIQHELPHFEKFAVSRDGRLLFGGSKRVWFYRSL